MHKNTYGAGLERFFDPGSMQYQEDDYEKIFFPFYRRPHGGLLSLRLQLFFSFLNFHFLSTCKCYDSDSSTSADLFSVYDHADSVTKLLRLAHDMSRNDSSLISLVKKQILFLTLIIVKSLLFPCLIQEIRIPVYP